MQKQAPSLGRILVAVGFALSCFGLILFLWIAFGGPVPLKPRSYRITTYLPEATQLAIESDVRIGGVSVGKVKTIELAPKDKRVGGEDTTAATLEIKPEFAPISSDANAILRQKTLLGETYVELTSGTEPGGQNAPVSLGASSSVSDSTAQNVQSVPEGGSLGIGQTKNATQIDEIFNALDAQTRRAFQRWQANASVAINGRGVDLNDALGNLGPFLGDASNILATLRRQKSAVKGLVRDTGTVFNALSERSQELAGAITGSQQTFAALARENQALADSFKILPVFQRESRLTLGRLDQFQVNTRPLIQKLLPVANDISPTLRSVRLLSPNLKNLFIDLRPLIKASRKGFPAARDFLHGLTPVLDALDPFLANLNPVIRYLLFYRTEVTGFLNGPEQGFATLNPVPAQTAPKFSLRVLTYFSAETLGIHSTRLATNRGNAYPMPNSFTNVQSATTGIFGNFDCKNLDYTPVTQPPDEDPVALGQTPPPDVHGGLPPDVGFAPCYIAGNFPAEFGGGRAPNLFADP